MEANTRVVSLSALLIFITIILDVQVKAAGRLIFEENFDSKNLDKFRWSREIRIPLDPDYQFCVYHKHDETVKINDGVLHIKPSLFDDSYGEDAVYNGNLRLADCTGSDKHECQQQARSYQILPPVISAKLITRNHFEFRYGIIEVRAKFPAGDWMYPEIWLEPSYKSFESHHANARVYLGRARGNAVLTRIGNSHDDFGAGLLEFGVGNGTGSDFREELVTKSSSYESLWTNEFHVFKTTWTSSGLTFHVNNEEVGKIERDNMAPFDEKFYLSIGLGIGGVSAFPDETQTNSYVKPWKNTSPKAMLMFWKAKDKWLPTWQRNQGSNAALEIDYIKVWTL